MVECHPIGTAHTPFDDRSGTPRQGFLRDAPGWIELDPEYERGLDGIEPGDDVLVVWFADRADRSALEARGRGVFTTRSPARPNPICLTRCTVTGVGGTRLDVRGVDMLDGSPVLDLKPPL